MDSNQKERLLTLLATRSKKIESIQHFDEYFEIFIRNILRKVLNEINEVLIDKTNETLRMFLENPYDDVKSRYFVMVQLMPETHRKNTFLFDNIRSLPTITFEGDEYSGKVKVWIRIKDRRNGSEIDIDKLTEIRTFDFIFTFIDSIYKI